MRKLKILITGATGFVGKKFSKSITERYANTADIYSVSFTKMEKNALKVDLADFKQVDKHLGDINPDYVFHFAAMVNPKINEEKKLESFRKNFQVTNNLINVFDSKTTIFFLSTDKVYDPIKKGQNEDEILDIPNNFYSLMKIICEEIIRVKFPKHFILRCPIIHSEGEYSSNSFIDESIIQLSKKQEVNAFTNIIRHYLLVDELIDFLISIIDSDKFGTYNVGSEPASYYDRIYSIAKKKGLDVALLKKDTGLVLPQIQLLNLDKQKNIFRTIFN